MSDHDMPDRCWCSRSAWDGHTHFGLTPVEFGLTPRREARDWHILLTYLGVIWLATAAFLACS